MTMWIMILLALLLAGPLLTLAFGKASMRATGARPPIARRARARSRAHRDAVVQVYASRTFGWRGAFADHTWIAVKPPVPRAIRATRSSAGTPAGGAP
jgi:hypothetical protein